MKKNKSLTGLKGLELKGGYCFVKKNNGKKSPKSCKNSKKIWSW